MKVTVSQSCLTLRPCGLHSSWNSQDQNTGVDSLSLFQGIFQTQGSSPGLLYYRQILYQLSHQGSSRILEWVAYPFSSRSSRPRNRTQISNIARRILYQLSHKGSPVSGLQQSNSGYLQIILHGRLFQDNGYNSLWYIVHPCSLSVLSVANLLLICFMYSSFYLLKPYL